MHVGRIERFTVRCEPADLGELREFYVGLRGLVEAPRPDFSFPGHWLYSEGHAIVHLAGLLDSRSASGTGPLDQIAFSGRFLNEFRQPLKAKKVAFDERPVPGFTLHQAFVGDPQGLKIELTFEVR